MSPIPVPLPLVIYLLAGMLLGAVLVMGLARLPAEEGGWAWRNWRTPVLGLGWGGLLAALGLVWFRYLLHAHHYLPVPVAPRPLDWLLVIIALPAAEELFFRGAILGGLQRSWRPFWAIMLSATFSAICLPYTLLQAFVFLTSLGYACAFRSARSLSAPFIAHVLVAAILLLARIHPHGVIALPMTSVYLAGGVAAVMIFTGSVGERR